MFGLVKSRGNALRRIQLPGECVPFLEMDAAYGQVRQPFVSSMFCLQAPHLDQDLADQAYNEFLKNIKLSEN
jgi:hypothetical protein